jgi:hypothetical protein
MATNGTKICPFCGSLAHVTQDDKYRVHSCSKCFSANVISKGANSWWYHGWIKPDGTGIDADGRKVMQLRFGFWLPDAEASAA